MSKAEYPDGSVIQYTYDAAGNRISKEVTIGTVLGYANGDGSTDVRDVISIINVILGTGTASGNPDCNGDGSVNVLDVICVINKILGVG